MIRYLGNVLSQLMGKARSEATSTPHKTTSAVVVPVSDASRIQQSEIIPLEFGTLGLLSVLKDVRAPIANIKGTRSAHAQGLSKRLSQSMRSGNRSQFKQSIESQFAHLMGRTASDFDLTDQELIQMHRLSLIAEAMLDALRAPKVDQEFVSEFGPLLEEIIETEYQFARGWYSKRYFKSQTAYWYDLSATHGHKDAAQRLLQLWSNNSFGYQFLKEGLSEDDIKFKIGVIRSLLHGPNY